MMISSSSRDRTRQFFSARQEDWELRGACPAPAPSPAGWLRPGRPRGQGQPGRLCQRYYPGWPGHPGQRGCRGRPGLLKHPWCHLG